MVLAARRARPPVPPARGPSGDEDPRRDPAHRARVRQAAGGPVRRGHRARDRTGGAELPGQHRGPAGRTGPLGQDVPRGRQARLPRRRQPELVAGRLPRRWAGGVALRFRFRSVDAPAGADAVRQRRSHFRLRRRNIVLLGRGVHPGPGTGDGHTRTAAAPAAGTDPRHTPVLTVGRVVNGPRRAVGRAGMGHRRRAGAVGGAAFRSAPERGRVAGPGRRRAVPDHPGTCPGYSRAGVGNAELAGGGRPPCPADGCRDVLVLGAPDTGAGSGRVDFRWSGGAQFGH